MEGIEVRIDMPDLQSPVAVVRLKGVVDTTTAPIVERHLNEVVAQSTYRIVMDLSKTDYISSAGWGVFISKIRSLREHGGDMLLAGMVPEVQEVFELLEFPQVFRAFSTPDEAVHAFLDRRPLTGPRVS